MEMLNEKQPKGGRRPGLGTGTAEQARQTLLSRRQRLDDAIEESSGGKKKK